MKLHKKNLEIYIFFCLRKLSRLRGQFCSTALVIDTFYVKLCSVLTQNYNIDFLIGITFLSKKNISISFIQFYATKTSDKLSVNIDHVYYT